MSTNPKTYFKIVYISIFIAILFSWEAYSYPVVTSVHDPSFSDIADLRAREYVTDLKRVDFKKYPELKKIYEDLIELTEKILIEEDGKRPIRLILVDDITPNAAFVPTTKGDRIVIVNSPTFLNGERRRASICLRA